MKPIIIIHPDDSVAVALREYHTGDTVNDLGLTLQNDIPAGHKIALRPIKKGQPVLKYGMPIGAAAEDIPAGAHVHTHNLETLLSGELAYAYTPKPMAMHTLPARMFTGYKRKHGRAGRAQRAVDIAHSRLCE